MQNMSNKFFTSKLFTIITIYIVVVQKPWWDMVPKWTYPMKKRMKHHCMWQLDMVCPTMHSCTYDSEPVWTIAAVQVKRHWGWFVELPQKRQTTTKMNNTSRSVVSSWPMELRLIHLIKSAAALYTRQPAMFSLSWWSFSWTKGLISMPLTITDVHLYLEFYKALWFGKSGNLTGLFRLC